MTLIDITGQRFGMLVVLRRAEGSSHNPKWFCLCDCGREHVAFGRNIRGGFTKSCGCRISAVSREKATTHGMSGTPEYLAWSCMKNRCFKPQDKQYPNYGGRGIKVCEGWRNSFEAFYAHVGPRPSADHSIDRINNDGNYEPGNVRWATASEQTRNMRCTKLTAAGAMQVLRMREAGVPFAAIREEFGISDALISNIQAGRAWRDVFAAFMAEKGARAPTTHDSEDSQARRQCGSQDGRGAVLHGGGGAELLAATSDYHRERARTEAA